MLVALPDEFSQALAISMFLRERTARKLDVNQEYAFDIIEEYLLNQMGGYLWDVLRVKNQLVYQYGLYNLDFDTAKYKNFFASTTPAKMRKTISEICKVIRKIGQEGVPEADFEKVKKVLCDVNSATLNKLKKTSAISNFNGVLYGEEFIDYKKVNAYISKMTCEEFNKHIMPVYSAANVSVAIQGNFDTRKCYTLIEIEKMLGNYSHVENVQDLNVPRIEQTSIVQDPMALMASLLGVENIELEFVTEEQTDDSQMQTDDETQKTTKKKTTKKVEPVTIDNTPVK